MGFGLRFAILGSSVSGFVMFGFNIRFLLNSWIHCFGFRV